MGISGASAEGKGNWALKTTALEKHQGAPTVGDWDAGTRSVSRLAAGGADTAAGRLWKPQDWQQDEPPGAARYRGSAVPLALHMPPPPPPAGGKESVPAPVSGRNWGGLSPPGPLPAPHALLFSTLPSRGLSGPPVPSPRQPSGEGKVLTSVPHFKVYKLLTHVVPLKTAHQGLLAPLHR